MFTSSLIGKCTGALGMDLYLQESYANHLIVAVTLLTLGIEIELPV